DWILRELRGPVGGFCSALDADSPGGEGSFYVWTLAELRALLGADGDAAIAWFAATKRGNFAGESGSDAGLNVLRADGPEPPAEQRERILSSLLEAREQRPRPALDDKRLTSWNALAIAARADAGAALGGAAGSRYLDAARTCADFVLRELWQPGRLRRTYNQGRASLDGYLEDYAFLLEALLLLYEATFEERWFVHARALADEL